MQFPSKLLTIQWRSQTLKFRSESKLAETPLIDRRIKEGFSPLVKCAQLAFSSKLLTISGKSQRKYQSTTSIGLTVLGIIGVARKEGREEGRKGYLVGRLRRCGRIVWFPPQSPSDSRRGRREGGVSRTPTKSSHKSKSKGRGREGGVEQS